MDFLLLLDGNVRVVIEVDGVQHYATRERASPELYGEMVAEDRLLRLLGYELYRFGGAEFRDASLVNGRYLIGPQAKSLVADFFNKLFEKHQISR
jgi:hypothetical protein